jgi:excisionase family DNA binding protein
MVKFSAGQAAKQVGVAKTTITRAIKDGTLSAEMVRGSYEIDASELFRVFPPKQEATAEIQPELQRATQEDVLLERIKGLEQMLRVERERNIELLQFMQQLRKDYDDWKEQTQRVTLRLQHFEQQDATPKKPWWKRSS